jgi:hypothetical protein
LPVAAATEQRRKKAPASGVGIVLIAAMRPGTVPNLDPLAYIDTIAGAGAGGELPGL